MAPQTQIAALWEAFFQTVTAWTGLRPDREQQARFRLLLEEVLRWNQRMHLTGHRTPEDVLVYHFLDSLSLLAVLPPPQGVRLADVGTGPGFPGLPLKILRPDLRLTLFEASTKMARFLDHVLERLALPDVTLVVERVERAARQPEHRERYDWAVARGVAPLPTLVEYLLPLVHPGGRAVAYKGRRAQEEAQAAQYAVQVLGGEIERVLPVTVPQLPAARALVVLRKVQPTPARYPRKPGIPAKRPLTPGRKP